MTSYNLEDLESGVHGGNCCGVGHLFCWYSLSPRTKGQEEVFKKRLRYVLSQLCEYLSKDFCEDDGIPDESGYLVEFVFNMDSHQKHWASYMSNHGIEPVKTTTNPNTGNVLHMYVVTIGELVEAFGLTLSVDFPELD